MIFKGFPAGKNPQKLSSYCITRENDIPLDEDMFAEYMSSACNHHFTVFSFLKVLQAGFRSVIFAVELFSCTIPCVAFLVHVTSQGLIKA